MPERTSIRPAPEAHGATRLPAVDVESYNIELKDDEGFVGDRASKGAFRALIENWRKPLRELGRDPFSGPSSALTRKRLDTVLTSGNPEAVGIVQSAIEGFAHELALVTRRFLKLKAWKNVERVVVGGGFSSSRVGELAIGRALVILRAEKIKIDLIMWTSAAPTFGPEWSNSTSSAHRICPGRGYGISNYGATATRSLTATTRSRASSTCFGA